MRLIDYRALAMESIDPAIESDERHVWCTPVKREESQIFQSHSSLLAHPEFHGVITCEDKRGSRLKQHRICKFTRDVCNAIMSARTLTFFTQFFSAPLTIRDRSIAIVGCIYGIVGGGGGSRKRA